MRTRRSQGFTLIELLTVIVIIAILVALLFPAIQSAIRKAEMAQAKTDINSIVTAVSAYKNDYGKLPLVDGSQGSDVIFAGGNATAINPLLGGAYDSANVNPRKTAYLSLPTRKGAFNSSTGDFLDPWGTPYVIIFDSDYNGTILLNLYFSGASGSAPGPVLVASYGPDHLAEDPNSSSSDDIYNFK